MGEQLRVTPSALVRSGNELGVIAEDLQLAHHRVENLRSWQIGATNIDAALNHLADHWRYGMSKMVESVRFTGEALVAAGRTYGDVEIKLADVFQRGQS